MLDASHCNMVMGSLGAMEALRMVRYLYEPSFDFAKLHTVRCR